MDVSTIYGGMYALWEFLLLIFYESVYSMSEVQVFQKFRVTQKPK